MTDQFRVFQVNARAVYPLRLLVLRPGGQMRDCIFAGDNAATTFHLGAGFTSNDLIGIASFYAASHGEVAAKSPVQLRGMATHPTVRGKGAGKEIIRFALELLKANGVDVLWCNAREIAVKFYESLGFVKIGDPFEIPGIGVHWVMVREVQ